MHSEPIYNDFETWGIQPGRGALQYFRYQVCAAGQGIIFTIVAPKPGIFFCKNALKGVCNFQIFALGQDYDGNFAPRQGI